MSCCIAPKQTLPWQVLKAAPWIFYVGMAVLFSVTWSPSVILFLLVAGSGAAINDTLIKYLCRNMSSAKRPNPPCDGCSPFTVCNGDVIQTSGMPSGHSFLMAFILCVVVVFAIMRFKQKKHLGETTSQHWAELVGTIMVVAAAALGVMYSRNAEGCHSVAQIGWGAFGGIVWFLVWYFVFIRNIRNHTKKGKIHDFIVSASDPIFPKETHTGSGGEPLTGYGHGRSYSPTD